MSTAVAQNETAQQHTGVTIYLDGVRGVKVHFYQVRTVTFCLLVFNETGMEFFDFAKCHTKDRNDVEIGRRKALGRALALTTLARAERLDVVAAAFPPF